MSSNEWAKSPFRRKTEMTTPFGSCKCWCILAGLLTYTGCVCVKCSHYVCVASNWYLSFEMTNLKEMRRKIRRNASDDRKKIDNFEIGWISFTFAHLIVSCMYAQAVLVFVVHAHFAIFIGELHAIWRNDRYFPWKWFPLLRVHKWKAMLHSLSPTFVCIT